MRSCLVAASILAAACGSARACGEVAAPCGQAAVLFPVFTPEGVRVGVLAARVRRVPVLETNPLDGQPLAVIYGHPGGAPGAVAPDTVLVRLPATRRSAVQGVFPRGY